MPIQLFLKVHQSNHCTVITNASKGNGFLHQSDPRRQYTSTNNRQRTCHQRLARYNRSSSSIDRIITQSPPLMTSEINFFINLIQVSWTDLPQIDCPPSRRVIEPSIKLHHSSHCTPFLSGVAFDQQV